MPEFAEDPRRCVLAELLLQFAREREYRLDLKVDRIIETLDAVTAEHLGEMAERAARVGYERAISDGIDLPPWDDLSADDPDWRSLVSDFRAGLEAALSV